MFLKDLFENSLPISKEKMEDVQNYFSLLEKAIYTNEDVRREEFPPIDPDIAGSREYKYHSAAAFKEHASKSRLLDNGQNVDSLKCVSEEISATQGQSTTAQDLECVSISRTGPDHSGPTDSGGSRGTSDDHNMQG